MTFNLVDDNFMEIILSNYINYRNYKNSNSTDLFEKYQRNLKNIHKNEHDHENVKENNLDEIVQTSEESNSKQDFAQKVVNSFSKFVEFTHNLNTENSMCSKLNEEQLSSLCYPLFFYIFIQMFECGFITKAQEFYSNFKKKFSNKQDTQNLVLSAHASLVYNKLHSSLQKFRNRKYRAVITENSLKLLADFLKENDEHSLLLTIFDSNFTFFNLKESTLVNDLKKDSLNFFELNKINQENSTVMNDVLNAIQSMKNSNDDNQNFMNYSNKANKTAVCQFRMESTKISSVAVSQDLSKIAVGNESSEIILWDFNLANNLQYYSTRMYRHWKRIPLKKNIFDIDFEFVDHVDTSFSEEKNNENLNLPFVEPMKLRGHCNTVHEIKFLNNSNFLLSCSSDSTIRLWDINSESFLALYKGHSHSVWTIDSNDKGCFVSGSRDGNAFMWDVERTLPIRMYCAHSMDINRIRFHPNNNYLATASADKTVILWDVNQAKQVRMFCGHKAPINDIVFSSCGKYLASASDDGNIQIWDISQGRSMMELLDHQEPIRCLALNESNQLLASCGAYSSSVYVWENAIDLIKSQQHGRVPCELIDTENKATKNHSLIYAQFIRPNVLLVFSKNRA